MSGNGPWVSAPIGVIFIVATAFVALAVLKTEQRSEDTHLKMRQIYMRTRDIAPIGSLVDRAVTAPQAYREEWRSERDLDAQQTMAYWAKWVTWATAGGVIVGMISVVLLWVAAVYTKRAADATQLSAKIAERSHKLFERPFIIPALTSNISRTSGHSIHHGFRYKLGNYGRVPAIIHYVYTTFGSTPSNHPGEAGSGVRTFDHEDYNLSSVLSANEMLDPDKWVLLPGVIEVEYDQRGKLKRLSYGELPDVYFAIHAKFEDMAGEVYESRFLWRFDQNSRRFLKHGGRDFNYERRVGDL